MKAKDFAIGALIGGVATGIAVALTTPKNGVELRADIKKEAENAYENSRDKFDKTVEVVTEKASETKVNLDDALTNINSKVVELKEEAMNTVEELKTKAAKNNESNDIKPNINVVKDEVEAELEELNDALNIIE